MVVSVEQGLGKPPERIEYKAGDEYVSQYASASTREESPQRVLRPHGFACSDCCERREEAYHCIDQTAGRIPRPIKSAKPILCFPSQRALLQPMTGGNASGTKLFHRPTPGSQP